MARITCKLEVQIEFDSIEQRLKTSTVYLPTKDHYTLESGPELSPSEWLRVLDWSWDEWAYVSEVPKATEFDVIGYRSKSLAGEVVRVTTDTPMPALALAEVSTPPTSDGEFVAVATLFAGEVVGIASGSKTVGLAKAADAY